jgi:hypothetical protein
MGWVRQLAAPSLRTCVNRTCSAAGSSAVEARVARDGGCAYVTYGAHAGRLLKGSRRTHGCWPGRRNDCTLVPGGSLTVGGFGLRRGMGAGWVQGKKDDEPFTESQQAQVTPTIPQRPGVP